jgi:hypothetical protein
LDDRYKGRAPHVVVAASNASATWKNRADYICSGTGDESTINSALSAVATSGGTVELSDGAFSLSGAVAMGSNQMLAGQGNGATVLNRTANNPFVTLNGSGSDSHVEFSGVRDLQLKSHRLHKKYQLRGALGKGGPSS